MHLQTDGTEKLEPVVRITTSKMSGDVLITAKEHDGLPRVIAIVSHLGYLLVPRITGPGLTKDPIEECFYRNTHGHPVVVLENEAGEFLTNDGTAIPSFDDAIKLLER